MADDWKQQHANEADKAVYHPLVQEVIEELLFNLRVNSDSLEAYGIRKVAMYAAQVARAQALGFDPELLKMTRDEANASIMDLAAWAVRNGKPTWIVSVTGEPQPEP